MIKNKMNRLIKKKINMLQVKDRVKKVLKNLYRYLKIRKHNSEIQDLKRVVENLI